MNKIAQTVKPTKGGYLDLIKKNQKHFKTTKNQEQKKYKDFSVFTYFFYSMNILFRSKWSCILLKNFSSFEKKLVCIS